MARSRRTWVSVCKQPTGLDEFFYFFCLVRRVWYLCIKNSGSACCITSRQCICPWENWRSSCAVICWIIFLPKNTTAFLQPLDAGVITFLKKTIQKKAISTCFVVDWKWEHKKLVQCVRIISYGIIDYELEWNGSKDYSQLLEKTDVIDSSTTTNLEDEEEIEAFNYEGEADRLGSFRILSR